MYLYLCGLLSLLLQACVSPWVSRSGVVPSQNSHQRQQRLRLPPPYPTPPPQKKARTGKNNSTNVLKTLVEIKHQMKSPPPVKSDQSGARLIIWALTTLGEGLGSLPALAEGGFQRPRQMAHSCVTLIPWHPKLAGPRGHLRGCSAPKHTQTCVHTCA